MGAGSVLKQVLTMILDDLNKRKHHNWQTNEKVFADMVFLFYNTVRYVILWYT